MAKLDIEDLTVERVRGLIEKVLNSPTYRENARWFQKVIAQSRGLDLAAEAIERGFKCELKPGISECYVISQDKIAARA